MASAEIMSACYSLDAGVVLKRGPVELVTPPTLTVFQASDAKQHCRIDSNADDGLIDAWIEAATRLVQRLSGRQLLTATYDLPLSDWWAGLLKLPRAPLQSVTSLKYYDNNEVQQTISTSDYYVKTPAEQPGYIELHPDNFDWPSLYRKEYPVTVRFVCGWTAASSVPATFKQAVLLLVGHWYEHRETSLVGTISKEIEFAVTALLDSEDMGCYA